MRKVKKIVCLLLAVLMLLSMNVPVLANDNTQTARNIATVENADTVEITVSTDKNSYKTTNVATIYVTVKNVGDEDLENVKTQVIFNDLQPVSRRNSTTSKEVSVLKAGESFDFSYKATLNINKHNLNFFQKIFLWFVRLFNGGYTVNSNSMEDVIAENVSEIKYGNFDAENIVQVGYAVDYSDSDDKTDDSDNSENDVPNTPDIPNVPDSPTYEELIENVDIDSKYRHNADNISIDVESGIEYTNNIIIVMFDENCTNERRAEIVNSINGINCTHKNGHTYCSVKRVRT